MRLRSLELIGFKSFVDRTVVTFDDGITSIVGPNGSGKSNVVDAIRWVMGEQSAKHLRGSEMSDVIFNGSEARPATGMASVFLTFDNSDGRAPAEYASYSEITIGRRLYRSGESEYYINKVPCRLKDIVEFFLGTGVGTKAYSIVEQGQVERIVSAKPEERRQLLEEAAGISKFKMHRDSALRKIEATKQNLARLADITSELEHQKNSLSRQAKKAERHKVFADELRDMDLSLASHNYRNWSSDLERMKNELSRLSEDETLKSAELSNIETTIDSIKIELSEEERRLNVLQENVYELQNTLKLNEAEVKFKTDSLSERRKRIEEDKEQIETLKVKKAELDKDVETINSSKVNSDIELASFEESVSGIQRDSAALNERLAEITGKTDLLRSETMECVRLISGFATRAEGLDASGTDIAGKIAKNQTELDSMDGRIKDIEAQMSGASGALDGMRLTKDELSREIEGLSASNESLKNDILHTEAAVAEISGVLSSRRSRLVSLEELSASFEGYNEGVRAVLKKKSESEQFTGIFGTISDMIETEPQYEAAVSAALGEKLQYVVVRSHQEGIEAIDYLKTASAGRSTFVPLEVREFSEPVVEASGEGVIGPLLNHVKLEAEHKKVGNYLLGDIVLVEDLRKALSTWRSNGHDRTFVTLDGEVVDRHGVVTGGSSGDVSGQFLAKKREISELRVEVARLSQEVSARTGELTSLKDRLQVNESRMSDLKNQVHSHEVEFVHKERDVQGLAQQAEGLKIARDRLTLETVELSSQRDAGLKEKVEILKNIAAAEEKKRLCEEENLKLAAEAEEIKIRWTAVSEELTAKRVQLASLSEQSASFDRELKRQTEAVAEAVSNLELLQADIEEGVDEIKTTEEAITRLRDEIGQMVGKIETVTAEQSQLKIKYDRDNEELKSKELMVRELRRSHEDIKTKVYELKLDETRLAEKVFYLEREVQERYHIDLAARNHEFEMRSEEGETVEQTIERVTSRVTELKDRLEKMGSVNSEAISEYEEVLKRYEFLHQQSEDLKLSLDMLQKAIIRINRTSKERFVETFNAVNERFKALFPRLFKGGGKAELILLDRENVLESGIEITAQPPGKKLQSVGLLSGGEKALVATTFIFSIFLIKPSPFCLLDEVDAPLDDANIDRFNQLVREMSSLSQFIMITHNRRTMELADTLYGVTMEEAGISKILSVKLEVAREHAATE